MKLKLLFVLLVVLLTVTVMNFSSPPSGAAQATDDPLGRSFSTNPPSTEDSANRPAHTHGVPRGGSSLPSQSEIQQQLVDMGFDIGPKGVDGIIGEDSRLAWDKASKKIRDRAICEQYALPIMRRFRKGEKQ